jgi:hypothetical protein
MSKWSRDAEEQRQRIYRALVVGEYTDASALDHLRATNDRLDTEDHA